MYSKVVTILLLVILAYVPDGIYAQDSSAVTTTERYSPPVKAGVQGGVGYQKGLFAGLSVKWEWFYSAIDFGYNVFHSNNSSIFSISVGWLPSSTRDGDGLFVNFIGSSSNLFSSNSSDEPGYVSANVGWLSYQPKKVSYSILLGPGLKSEQINGGEVKRSFFVNAEASIGYAF